MQPEQQSAKPKRARLLIVSAAAAACLVVAVVVARKAERPRRTLPLQIDLAQHFILTPADGILTQILVSEGETVAESASLVQLGSPDYGLRIREAREAVDAARMAVGEARLSAVAARAPGAEGIDSRAVETAARALKRKEAELDSVRREESEFTVAIRAPFSGQVLRILHREGAYVREGQPLLILLQSLNTNSPQR